MNALPPIPAAVILALLLGSGLLVLATALAVHRRGTAGSLAWMVVAGLSSCLLLLAAALQFREGDALRVAVVQLLMVTLAALLGALCGRAPETPPAPAVGLPTAGRGLSWLTLLGLPPTLGFHAKLMLYHTLLATGWGGLVVLTMAASAAGLAPAVWALRSPPPAPVRGLSAVLAAALMALVLVLGLYPQPVLGLAGLLEKAVTASR